MSVSTSDIDWVQYKFNQPIPKQQALAELLVYGAYPAVVLEEKKERKGTGE